MLGLSSKGRRSGINNPQVTKTGHYKGPITGESRLGQRSDVSGREVQKRWRGKFGASSKGGRGELTEKEG